MILSNYNDFVQILLDDGFTIGGGNDEGIHAIVNFDWLNTPPGSPIRWHTGDKETDPWEWRIRVLNERNDIAYSKCFFRKSGYITKEFYPYFLALRRGGRELEDEYADGLVSYSARRIYDTVQEHSELPLHELKAYSGFGRDDKSRFDSALTELQMRLYLTICSARRRMNAKGEEYGWETTAFCTTERFWEDTDVFSRAKKMSESDAYVAIHERVHKINPDANEKRIHKFAYGK